MNKLSKFIYLLWGILSYPLAKLIPLNKEIYVFGSGNGNYYSDNSKYLFEYYIKNGNKDCWWITRNRDLYHQLKKQGLPVLLNHSFKGIYKIQQAGVIIYSTSRIDIMYAHKRKGRKIINLFHAMPLKKVIYDYDGVDQKREHFFDRLWNIFVAGFKWEDSDLTLSSSEYFNSVMKSAFRVDQVNITGLPRNDFFFKEVAISNKSFCKLIEEKLIISYLPTHRKFGVGNQAETPFLKDVLFQEQLVAHNACLIHKPHYNVAKDKFYKSEAIIEYPPGGLDAQEILKYSSILITDYSSCYIDYLLLDRPVIFYRFDNYTKEDTGLYEKVEKVTSDIGPICETEEELKKALLSLLEGNDPYKETRTQVKKLFHQYTNGSYSERVYHLIEQAHD